MFIQTKEEFFKVVPETDGKLFISNFGNVKSFKTPTPKVLKGAVTKRGYKVVSVNGKTTYVHHLVANVFLNHTSDGHKIVIDHIDRDKLNNRVNNLRLVSQRENQSNRQTQGSSKYVGVSYHKSTGKWVVKIMIDGEQNTLGLFEKELDAHNAYQNKLKEITNIINN